MKRFLALALGLLAIGPAAAQKLFVDGFEDPFIAPQFPQVNGVFQLPPGPAVDQVAWLLSELAANETTTAQEIGVHFSAAFNVANLQNFFVTQRALYPNAVIKDVIAVTPVRVVAVIDSPGSTFPSGFLVLDARYTGDQRIVFLRIDPFQGSVQFAVDQSLTLPQAADKFLTLAPESSLLVARIGANGNCTAVVERNAAQPRATASIFKIWVLGAVARAIANGAAAITDPIALVASELAPGGTINSEPLGTLFPLRDLAILMLGISDNTATDLLHELVGRLSIGQFIVDAGVAVPELLTPLLSINEQFHLLRSFTLAKSLTYVNGTETFQDQFLQDEIIPLGPLTSQPFFNVELLTAGTWRASPLDICATFAKLRLFPRGSDAAALVDAALGAQAAQPNVRGAWDRVWYKGGSLASGAGLHVLTHAWMLESNGAEPYVVVAMSNHPNGGINEFNVQSVNGRILQLVASLP